jgi:hypothetical protein
VARRNELQLKALQRRCARALRLYTDLAEASCEMICRSERGWLPPRQRARLLRLSRQETIALNDYLQARTNLVAALSDNLPPADDKEVCRVISATT